MEATNQETLSLLSRAEARIIPAGTAHKFNATVSATGYPMYLQRGEGPRVYDLNGVAYLDYLMGFGPYVLGYGDPAMQAAITRQLVEGTVLDACHPLEVTVAEQLSALIPCAEMVGYYIGGSAATSGAVQLARAYTGRDYIIRCGYHGWHDWAQPGGAGVPKRVGALTLHVPYNNLDALRDCLRGHAHQVGAVIVETIQEAGPADGYLQGVIDLSHQAGAVVIFDEVKAGFRVAYGGGHEHYGVLPDMATYGKAICNGFPASLVVGRRAVVGSERCRRVYSGATFHGDLLSLTAMTVVMAEMQRRDGIAYQWRIGQRLMDGINAVCAARDFPFRLVGLAPMPMPQFAEADFSSRILPVLQGCLRRGHYLPPTHCWYLSLAHTEADIDRTIAAVAEAIDEG